MFEIQVQKKNDIFFILLNSSLQNFGVILGFRNSFLKILKFWDCKKARILIYNYRSHYIPKTKYFYITDNP